uniref:Spindle and centriole-associated protein 1 n=1 Tax=Eptatretus burgeri TaxID=7764 RepID=A0A8C4NM19_EPTBU
MPLIGNKRPKGPKKLRRKASRPTWDSTMTDIEAMKATPEELAHRKEIHHSHHRSQVQGAFRSYRSHSKVHTQGTSTKSRVGREAAVTKEVLVQPYSLGEMLSHADRLLASAEDSYEHVPQRRTALLSVTPAPSALCKSRDYPSLLWPDQPTQFHLKALNDIPEHLISVGGDYEQKRPSQLSEVEHGHLQFLNSPPYPDSSSFCIPALLDALHTELGLVVQGNMGPRTRNQNLTAVHGEDAVLGSTRHDVDHYLASTLQACLHLARRSKQCVCGTWKKETNRENGGENKVAEDEGQYEAVQTKVGDNQEENALWKELREQRTFMDTLAVEVLSLHEENVSLQGSFMTSLEARVENLRLQHIQASQRLHWLLGQHEGMGNQAMRIADESGLRREIQIEGQDVSIKRASEEGKDTIGEWTTEEFGERGREVPGILDKEVRENVRKGVRFSQPPVQPSPASFVSYSHYCPVTQIQAEARDRVPETTTGEAPPSWIWRRGGHVLGAEETEGDKKEEDRRRSVLGEGASETAD